MKTILIPTDFSKSADNALNYGIEFALASNSKIILLHSNELDYQTLLYSLVVPANEAIKNESKRMLDIATQKLKRAGKIKYECVLKDTPLPDAIIDTAQEKKVDLILMGTKGAEGLKKFLVGSMSSTIIEKATCPVLVVPEQVKFKGLKRITFATKYEEGDIKVIKKLVALMKPFSAQINVLHVFSREEKEAHVEKQHMLAFVKKITDNVLYNNISFELLEGEDIEQKFENYLSKSSTHLLVMCIHQRNLIDRLFDHSKTKEMSYHLKYPLLAFHHTKTPIVF